MFSFPITLRYRNSMFYKTRSGLCASSIIYIAVVWLVIENAWKTFDNTPDDYKKEVKELFPDNTN